jgi:hypothetical protein
MRTLAILCLLAAAGGCWDDSRPIAWERPRTVIGPIALKAQVAYVDSALDRVTLLDLANDKPAISTRHIGRNAIAAIPSPDRHLLFVVTRGEEAIHPGEIDQAPALWVIDAQHPDAEARSYAIGSPFDQVAVSADDSVAIAYFSGAGPDAAGFFRNPNELAIVNLAEPPSDANPTLRTIRSFGSVPTGIVLSPPMVIPGAADPTPRILGYVMSDNELTLLDTTHPDRRDVSIRLDLGGAAVTPRQIVFAPDTASAYVRSDNANDVLEVQLLPQAQSGDANDFAPELAELGAGGGPTDIAVYDDPTGRRYLLAATPSTGNVVVIDADTAQFRTVPVADPIDRILLFPQGDDVVPHEALLASIASEQPRLHVLDLDHINDPLTEASTTEIDLAQPVKDVVAVPDRELAMVVHDNARTVLGILDMTNESTAPLLGVGQLDEYDFTPNGSHLIGATDGVSRIGFVDLDNLHPTDFRLDDPPSKVLATANRKVFVDHGDPLGRATIIPSPDATRADAIVLTGFLANDLLDQEP